MGVMEIILLIIGIGAFVVSFVLPAAKEEQPVVNRELTKEEINSLVKEQMKEIKSQVDDTVNEAVDYAMEKTERSLERISNEKIMAVNEYSDTVLAEINKNHQEVMFLYDMLNDKHVSLKNTASEVEKTAKEAKTATQEAQKASEEVKAATKSAEKIFPVFQPLQPEKYKVAEPVETQVKELKKPRSKSKTQEKATVDKKATDNVNNNDAILKLHKAGKSKVEIAKELGLGVGEVSLVIDLFKG